jgi:hypothetical protein
VRKIYEMLGCSSGYQITVTIWKSNDRISVPDIHPLRVVPGRVERYAIGLIQSLCENLHLPGFAIWGNSAEYSNDAAAAFGEKYVTIRSYAQQSRII